MNRDLEGRFVKRSEGIWATVFGIVLLATLILVLNHTQSARLDAYSAHVCQDIYGLDNSCNAIN